MHILYNHFAQSSFTVKFLIFIGIELLCLCFVSLLTVFLSFIFSGISLTRVALTAQDIILFILPALCAAYLFGGNPVKYLQADRSPGIGAVIGIVLCMLFSIPMMNLIIEWNESIILPEALSNIENWLKAQEASAQEMTRHMLQMSNIGDLTIMILIVGVLTGIGEEFVFRGIVQRLFLEKFRNRHIAVWTTAIIFSAIHFQFYGFVPRMLLGAFFGYLLVWSGNIWLPVTAHALNNSLSVIGAYIWHIFGRCRLDRSQHFDYRNNDMDFTTPPQTAKRLEKPPFTEPIARSNRHTLIISLRGGRIVSDGI